MRLPAEMCVCYCGTAKHFALQCPYVYLNLITRGYNMTLRFPFALSQMCRLLQAVVQQKTKNFEETEQYHNHQQAIQTVEDIQRSSYHRSPTVEDDFSLRMAIPKQVTLDVSPVQTPTNFRAALPIKEGLVEKKGHSVAFLMWPK